MPIEAFGRGTEVEDIVFIGAIPPIVLPLVPGAGASLLVVIGTLPVMEEEVVTPLTVFIGTDPGAPVVLMGIEVEVELPSGAGVDVDVYPVEVDVYAVEYCEFTGGTYTPEAPGAVELYEALDVPVVEVE